MSSEVHPPGPWRIVSFRRFWVAATVSMVGSEISELALPLLAISTLHASGWQLGWLRAAQFLPFLVATLWAGTVVDRMRRRPLMIWADLTRFVCVAAIPVLVIADIVSVWWLLPFVFVAGVATVVHEVSAFAYLPTLVNDGQLIAANSLIGSSQSAAQVGGRGLGGLIVSVSAPVIGLVVDATSYLLSAIGLSKIPDSEPHPTSDPDRSGASIDGVRWVLRDPLVRPLLGEATVCNFFVEVFTTGLLIFAARDVHLSAFAIGAIFAFGAVGALIGALCAARLSSAVPFGAVLTVAVVAGNGGALLTLLVGSTAGRAAVTMAAALFVFGAGAAIANVHAISLRQATAPSAVQARMNAGYRLISWGAISVGAITSGVVASAFGGRTAMWIGAAGMQLAALWIVASPIPRLRGLPERTATAP